jgi:UDP-4-amino-4,6-dideoxy-N-acetyl-beta-L-altrosamine transaminase
LVQYDFLACGQPHVTDDDIDAVVHALKSGWLTNGPAVQQLERSLVERFECLHAISCANGTAALHLALLGLGLSSTDTVIVPTLTFLATANAARYVGANIVFADVDPETGLMRPDHFEAAISRSAGRKPRVVVPVHFAGQAADIASINNVAARYSVDVLEDSSHAVGTWFEVNGKPHPIGSCVHSRASTFSFHPVKNITAGEGGAVLTNDSAMATKMALLRNHAMSRDAATFKCPDEAFTNGDRPNPWYYEMQTLGFNYRLSDINAALATSQLKRLNSIVSKRRELITAYQDRISDAELDIRMLAQVPGCRPGWHLCVVLIDFEAFKTTREQVMAELRQSGIGTQVHYLPLHRQPYYRSFATGDAFTGADLYYERALSLPLFPEMGLNDVDRVVGALSATLKGRQK